jgi:hypothetical protein
MKQDDKVVYIRGREEESTKRTDYPRKESEM